MAKVFVPVGEWLPDQPDSANAGSVNIKNVLPRTAASYGPCPSPQVFSSALRKRCQGFYAGLDSADAVHNFAGDANDLYTLLTANNGAWQQASKSAHAYNCAAGDMWRFAYMNSNVIAFNLADPPQYITLKTGTTFADLAGTPPKAKHGAVIKNFLMLGFTDDGVSVEPQLLHWSGLNDSTSWPTLGTNAAAQVQSSSNQLYGDGGWIQSVIGNLGTADGAIIQEHGVWRVMYAGPPYTFDFQPAEGAKGTPAPYSVVQDGPLAFYYSEDGFKAFDGGQSQPIGAGKIDKWFNDNVDKSSISRMVGAVDPIRKIVAWAVPMSGNNGNPNFVIFYEQNLERFTVASIVCETIGSSISFAYTLDQLYTVFGYTIDNLPYGLDSNAWVGGFRGLTTFDVNHKLNFLDGAALAATIDTAEGHLSQIGKRSMVRSARPHIEGTTVNATVSVGVRDNLDDAVVFGAATAPNAIGVCRQRVAGQYARGRITTQASDVWTHITGVDVDAVELGER